MYQQHLQGVLLQKEALHLQIHELEKTLDELGKAKDTEVFKIVGPILIKTTKSDIEKELNDRKEEINLKMKTLETTEKKIIEKVSGKTKEEKPAAG